MPVGAPIETFPTQGAGVWKLDAYTPAQGTVVPSDHYGVCVEARWDTVASGAEVREA